MNKYEQKSMEQQCPEGMAKQNCKKLDSKHIEYARPGDKGPAGMAQQHERPSLRCGKDTSVYSS